MLGHQKDVGSPPGREQAAPKPRVVIRSWPAAGGGLLVCASPSAVDAGDVPRHVWSSSATYPSAAKKLNVITPRSSTAAGTPDAARSVPGGVSLRNAGTSRTRPTNA